MVDLLSMKMIHRKVCLNISRLVGSLSAGPDRSIKPQKRIEVFGHGGCRHSRVDAVGTSEIENS
jgi:hypothetical protein